MNFLKEYVINWFIVIVFTYLLYITKNLNWVSFASGCCTPILIFLIHNGGDK